MLKILWNKITSRKFGLAAVLVATGLLVLLKNGDEDTIRAQVEAVTGALTALIAAVTYIITEGRIDRERAVPGGRE